MYDTCTEPPVIIELHMNDYPDDGQAHAKPIGHNTVNKYRKFCVHWTNIYLVWFNDNEI